jgi:murein DD-endopeptidase MepM/ murein hydrolase activator NlpD
MLTPLFRGMRLALSDALLLVLLLLVAYAPAPPTPALRATFQPPPATPAQLFPALYGGQPYWITQPLHGLPGWEGVDASAGCGAILYAPVSGSVTYSGLDGYIGPHGGPNTLLIITTSEGTAVFLLHGSYVAPVGTAVIAGHTVIGSEAAIGNATGCHTHLGLGIRGWVCFLRREIAQGKK